ncbi:tyrosine recombinase XerC [Pseudomethylobacillus aquaticus]|uniref:Tyrosine recombinase XerC n=1 Tax=Pseudomethylobacillus aquaticus TaxID=2676064 RepID=A0A3N0UZD9_9PROT|nr:tyrosine recombinase XerC [Pseudomethylobacillus aquaticus]ROH85805.1 tyrosine recombinase XerC [Pseudomethylobacillus aquaticus]
MTTDAQHAYLEAYLSHLRHERGLSQLTCTHYARDLKLLFSLLEDQPVKQGLTQLTVNHMRRHIATLHGRGMGSRSIARTLSAWRGFFHYLGERHGMTDNPCTGLRAPKAAKPLPQALSADQAVMLVEIQGDDALSLRDRAMLELLYSSGLRLSELVGLNLNALDIRNATLVVTGKGNKTRIVPVGSHAISAIQRWLVARSLMCPPAEQAMFINQRGKRLTGRSVQYRLKEWAIKQGINIDLHPHMLRHSFASHVLQSSGDLRAVQEMLGHANISTTQVYTHLDFHHLAKVYDAAHPRARKK